MKSKDRIFYPAVFTYEEGQEIAVEFPDLGVATSGVNDDDAFLSARELLGLTIFGMEQDQEEIPSPTPLNKIELKENERVVLIDVFMPAVRLEQNNKAVTRTVTVPAWLNAYAMANGINFSQTLQEGLCGKLGLLQR